MKEQIEKYYKVYDNGDIYSFRRNKMLVPKIDKYGYKCITLSLDSGLRYFTVHRLVALFYVPNPDNFPQVNHKDTIKLNNFYKNLEWCTVAYNTQHAYDNGVAKAWNKGKTGVYSQSLIDAMTKNQPNRKSVITKDLITGEERNFVSVRSLCVEMNFDRRTVMRILSGQKSYNTINGHKLFYS